MPKVDTSKLYADHPHLAQIDKMWGTRDCREFLTSLMHETRGGTRHGFPPDSASVIIRLLIEHDKTFPEFDEAPGGRWWASGGLDRHIDS